MSANRCPSCDYDEIGPEDSHCPACGYKLSEPNRIWFWAIAAVTMGVLVALVIWAVPSGSGSTGRSAGRAPAPAVPGKASSANRELVAQILPGVVSVQVPGANSQGSGWVWDNQGHIITNAHVVKAARQATVVTSDGTQLRGQVLGVNQEWDIAVIQAEGATDLRPLPLGQSAAVRPGDEVMAFGSPLGLENTVTDGLISAIRTDVPVESSRLGTAFQTSAAIAPGSSGGPLVEKARGTVIGVNTAGVSAEKASNIGFAVPVDEVRKVVERMIH